jgi:hypothetical protein
MRTSKKTGHLLHHAFYYLFAHLMMKTFVIFHKVENKI